MIIVLYYRVTKLDSRRHCKRKSGKTAWHISMLVPVPATAMAAMAFMLGMHLTVASMMGVPRGLRVHLSR